MKLKIKLFVIGLAWAATTAQAAIYNYNFDNINAVIPDGDTAGVSDTHTLSGMSGEISAITVTLNISGGYNGDLYGYLVSDSGFAVLLNRVGKTADNPYGSSTFGMNVTFNDSLGTDIHQATGAPGSVLTGTYASDGRNVDPNSVLNTDVRTATLSSFTGTNPNSKWTLFLADLVPIGQGTLNRWSMQVSTVPEPVSCALAGFAGLAAVAGLVRRALRSKNHSWHLPCPTPLGRLTAYA